MNFRARAIAASAAVVFTSFSSGAAAQGTAGAVPDPGIRARYDSAFYAWDAGRYPEALERLQRILSSPDGEQLLEPIALLTGELYHTVEITRDGRAPRWSGDGKHVAYETGSGDASVTHIVAYAEGDVRPVARLSGATGFVFSPDGRSAAYLRDDGRVILRELATGRERELNAPGITRGSLVFSSDGDLYLIGGAPGEATMDRVWRLTGATTGAVLEPGRMAAPIGDARPLAGSRMLLTQGGGRGGRGGRGGAPPGFAVLDGATGTLRAFQGSSPSASANGRFIAFVGRDGDENTISLLDVTAAAEPAVVKRSELSLAAPAPSPEGRRVAFQMMPREDWELYLVDADGSGEVRLTREIQHDLMPRFLSDTRVFAVMGEARHRRSYLYELDRLPVATAAPDTDMPAGGAGARLITTGPQLPERVRLFHNNTVRTVAPEYEWEPSPDGTKILIVADRDGNTVSPERGVYIMDLARSVTKEDLTRRLAASQAHEKSLRERGALMFERTAPAVRDAVARVSTGRISAYAHDLFQFDSKYITEPGNLKAIEYLVAQLRSFGYEPELQWFEARGVRTANVIAKLPGTVNPELIYVVSSHFDSVQRGPGADDDSSGTTALLEAARVLKDRPQPATIHFAFFTGEEAGLLGSREYVRRAQASGDRIVGALNNDMIGFANDHRLDNTIRYSNDGIRDIQHAAAFLFTNLITYDAKYYRSTDAAAYYEAYGDIVGGIGSYPILGNPHYHQPHDVLETINQQLVAEVSKTTVGTLMLLASSPSRLTGLEVVARRGSEVDVSWTPSPEQGVRTYVVAYGPPSDPMRRVLHGITEPRVTLMGVSMADVISVKAVDQRGAEGWDWARIAIGR